VNWLYRLIYSIVPENKLGGVYIAQKVRSEHITLSKAAKASERGILCQLPGNGISVLVKISETVRLTANWILKKRDHSDISVFAVLRLLAGRPIEEPGDRCRPALGA
jgi:hypothetical protein